MVALKDETVSKYESVSEQRKIAHRNQVGNAEEIRATQRGQRKFQF